MTGLNGNRVYLDWNATAPLRPEARTAMLSAMDEVGNPSSVHAEGRKAKAIVERARAQVADLVGCEPGAVVFTSGATEAAALALGGFENIHALPTEHDCVADWATSFARVTEDGIEIRDTNIEENFEGIVCIQTANSETGVLQGTPLLRKAQCLRDIVQSVGKDRNGTGVRPFIEGYGMVSGHKLGASSGTGALIATFGVEPFRPFRGGGQEQGRRAGTENVVGIAGFGAAAEAAKRDLENGEWDRVENLRNILELTLEDAAPDLLIFGRSALRLPNTSCFAIPGWKGETQVMQMDLSGFAVSAGSACSSGKVNKASRVLLAMGFDEVTASSAIRVSMGPTTTEAEVMAFADTWIAAYRRWKAKAA